MKNFKYFVPFQITKRWEDAIKKDIPQDLKQVGTNRNLTKIN